MELLAYAIFDTKAECFDRPFFVQNDAVAIRSIADALAGGQSPLSRHAGDYLLFCIGGFDDQRGAIEGFNPRNLGPIVSLAKSVIPFNNRDLFEKTDQADHEPTQQRDDASVLNGAERGDPA